MPDKPRNTRNTQKPKGLFRILVSFVYFVVHAYTIV